MLFRFQTERMSFDLENSNANKSINTSENFSVRLLQNFTSKTVWTTDDFTRQYHNIIYKHLHAGRGVLILLSVCKLTQNDANKSMNTSEN